MALTHATPLQKLRPTATEGKTCRKKEMKNFQVQLRFYRKNVTCNIGSFDRNRNQLCILVSSWSGITNIKLFLHQPFL